MHFVIDSEQAERLRAAWLPDRSVALDFVDCPDRRLTRAAIDLVSREAEHARHAGDRDPAPAQLPADWQVPARPHGRQDRRVVSRVPNAAATIIPFDVQNRIRVLSERQAERDLKARPR